MNIGERISRLHFAEITDLDEVIYYESEFLSEISELNCTPVENAVLKCALYATLIHVSVNLTTVSDSIICTYFDEFMKHAKKGNYNTSPIRIIIDERRPNILS